MVGFLQTVLKTASNKWKKTCQKMSVSGWIASVPLGSHWKASLGVGLFNREINIRVTVIDGRIVIFTEFWVRL